eukprot:TRINITY_DN35432_c0_g1_i1.p1 TRINITY_DN35432_c0_g1~~TRINITY_DN35432_c0_g1_i1.p1  ORF type:complete len:565 (-),score=113.43 TRINITY_DN35432_c0_g1_i1:93-1787(-)
MPSILSTPWTSFSAAWDDQTVRRLISRCALAYGAFGIVQVLCRMASASTERKRAEKMLQSVPQAKYKPGPHGYVSDMLKNFLRLNYWRAEISNGLPISKMLSPVDNVLLVRDPVIIRHFLKDAFSKYTKSTPQEDYVTHCLKQWLGDGIFTTLHGSGASDKGKSWERQRKIASQIFSRNNFNTLMQEVFEEKAQHLRKVLAQHCGQSVDLQLHFFNFTMDSILKIFFGEDSNTQSGLPNKYGKAFDEAHHSIFEYSLKSMPFAFKSSAFLPWPFAGHTGLACRLREQLSPLHRRFRAANRILDTESRRLVQACRSDPGLNQRRDLLALFVQAEEQENFSDSFLRDIVLNMVIAGRDTTACTLSWMFYALATNPEVQRQLCAEIDEKLPPGQKLTLKSLGASEMPYLNGVLYETLRMWPPVPSDQKRAVEDDILPDGTTVPRGTKLIFLPFATGHDPTLYPEPEILRPERWIPFKAPSPFEFTVFQAGPRICLGMDMAIFEAKLVAVELLRYYNFRLVPGQAEEITHGRKLTMAVNNARSTGGDSEELWVEVARRELKPERTGGA